MDPVPSVEAILSGEPTTPASTGDSQLPASRWQSVGRVFRTGLLCLVVASACYLAYAFGQLWAEWRELARPQPSRTSSAEAVPTLNPMIGALPLAGPWSFADLDWNVKTSTINRGDVDAHLEQLANPAANADVSRLPDLSPDILEMATIMHVVPEERDGYQIYRVNRPDLKAQLVVRNIDGHTKAVTIACSYPQSGERWQLFELTPREATPKADSQAAHLLPLPASAMRRGSRFADDGRLLLELITLDSNSDELVAAWKAAGWEVRPSGMGDPGSFSFLCAHGDDVIYAWSADPNESLKSLMLVLSPTDAELKTQQLIPQK